MLTHQSLIRIDTRIISTERRLLQNEEDSAFMFVSKINAGSIFKIRVKLDIPIDATEALLGLECIQKFGEDHLKLQLTTNVPTLAMALGAMKQALDDAGFVMSQIE